MPNGQCQTNCDVGFYSFLQSGDGTYICQSCDPSCYTCQQAGDHYCLKCPSGDFLYETVVGDLVGECKDDCDTSDGKYVVAYATSYAACRPCHSTCKTCSTSGSTYCTTCRENLVLQPTDDSVQLGECLAECEAQYVDTIVSTDVHVCKKCDTSCQACDKAASVNNCTACSPHEASHEYLQELDPSSKVGICTDTCYTGYYRNNTSADNFLCSQCNPACYTCLNSTQNNCTSCPLTPSLTKLQPTVDGSPEGAC